jgi:hypothetical protein
MNDARIPGDDELDRFLAAAFDEPPLPERDFMSAVSERLRRYRRRRRWAVGVVLSLVLTALCSLVWIGTEARTLRMTPNAGRAR